jgi:hypothetical protein
VNVAKGESTRIRISLKTTFSIISNRALLPFPWNFRNKRCAFLACTVYVSRT